MSDEEKTVVKGCSFCGIAQDGNSIQVEVKNGKIVRIRPLHFDWKYSHEYLRPWKIEARGKVFEPTMKSTIPPITLAYKNRVYSPNRILYPLKRVDWDPNGERNPENRGKSGYVRISWDEALDIVTGEIKRMYKQYGKGAILAQADGHGETKVVHGPHGCQIKLLNILGGYTLQNRNPDSWEGTYWGAKHVWGGEPVGKQRPQDNLVADIARNTEMILFWGCDPETTPWGWGGQFISRVCYWFTELGIKSIYVCPDINYGAAVHADKWIPILPSTDSALQLAIAYVWITEDLYDKEYVATHAVGFDKFKDYVLGKEDGIPKTPKWAAGITTVPSRITKVLARMWAAKRTCISHANGGPMHRGPFASEIARLEIVLMGMQGLGKPGQNQFTTIEWGLFGNGRLPGWFGLNQSAAYPEMFPDVHTTINTGHGTPKAKESSQNIPKLLIHDAILDPTPLSWYGQTWCGENVADQFVQYHYPKEGCSEVHMIWTDSPSWTTCWNGGNRMSEAFRSPKIEFMLAQHPWLENDCHFADVILPSCTKFETNDMCEDFFTIEYRSLIYDAKCCEPIGESISDYEIVCKIAEKMGVLKEFNDGMSVDDLIRYGFDHSGIQDKISFEDFKEAGYYAIPTDPNWDKQPSGLIKFYEDPENNPLSTPSGKLEFYSQRLADHFPDDKERPPVPHWVEKGAGHDERLTSARAKKYPLLVTSCHPRWRVHSQCDDMKWCREIETCKIKGPDGYAYQTMWLNPKEAAKRGIKNHDVVEIFNERGSLLAGAMVTERLMPGAVYIDHGARLDPIVVGKIDRGGDINTITPEKRMSDHATGMVVSGFLVDVKRADLDQLMRDYPEAFARPYDDASGLDFNRVVVHNK
jgi:molybdopterin guanine dinucleotide-containing S/N-oxide reductase-like protein